MDKCITWRCSDGQSTETHCLLLSSLVGCGGKGGAFGFLLGFFPSRLNYSDKVAGTGADLCKRTRSSFSWRSHFGARRPGNKSPYNRRLCLSLKEKGVGSFVELLKVDFGRESRKEG